MRTLFLLSLIAIMLTGCVVAPVPYHHRHRHYYQEPYHYPNHHYNQW